MPENITFLLGDQDDQICNHLSREFGQALMGMGFDIHFQRLTEIKEVYEFKQGLEDKNCKLIIAVAGMGLHMDNMEHFFNFLDIPMFTMYLDPPIPYWPKISKPVEKLFISALSDQDVQYIKANRTPQVPVFQLAHAATPKDRTPWHKKDIGVFYGGTLRNTPEATRQSWGKHGEHLATILNEIVEEHLKGKGRNLLRDVEFVLAQHNEINENQFSILRNAFFAQIDTYLRDLRRCETIRALSKSVPLTIAGKGWDQVIDTSADHINYLGVIHPSEIRTFNERAKMVLNAINQYHESHERVFSAIADGSVALSSNSIFYKNTFAEDSAIFFDWDLEALPERVNGLLNDDQSLSGIAEKGHEEFLQKHTWSHRAEKLCQHIF